MENINLNQANCIKEVLNIGSTKFINICNESFSVVPWGAYDWILYGVLGIMLLGIIALMITVAINMITDYIEYR